MSRVTAHVLDTTQGKPAAALEVTLERAEQDGTFSALSTLLTDENGRVGDLTGGAGLQSTCYRLTFATGPYFAAQDLPVFFPRVEVMFQVLDPAQHYHVPLLLSPFSYCTYRGS